MPRYYVIPKQLADAAPALGRLAQWLEAVGISFAFWILKRLSPERGSRIAAAVFRKLGPRTGKAKSVRRNMRVVFPDHNDEQIEDLCQQVFGQLGMATVELVKMRQLWAEREQRMEFVIAPQALAHLQAQRPTVFVTAHVGAWQLTNLISLHQDLTITTVYAAETNPTLHDLFLDLREAFGVKLLPTEDGVRPLMRELNAGNSIGLAMDNRLDSGSPIPFFGVDALTNTTAARLALGNAQAALIPIRAERLEPGYFRVNVYDPIISSDPNASKANQTLDMTRQINQHFESWIRETPEQWMCLKRRWPKPGKP
ncbi:lipid A biosynthesis acyltransferase [Halieaceae bacterium IMCC14734]|uniref:Lipid A biosynthesis acyltransferase n=1 Tax=Candidatus Litorirhabdus singularis TaxID=2518993 RepID=A0ABT3TJF7_9GAMM|nr:lysophospholipid acyltransferase family protein [Candidatus Litorirhabdus singularis]MCX2982443.1 lipid A biosynthesis acyltransferase [Candidatus Litorirhabdus singularis]